MKELLSEEKSLLLKDLCARLPYEPIIRFRDRFDVKLTPDRIMLYVAEEAQPYLRPMSSMTEDEKKEYKNCYQSDDTTTATLLVDFYNKKMFDYHGLIEKGLALEAPEGMYK